MWGDEQRFSISSNASIAGNSDEHNSEKDVDQDGEDGGDTTDVRVGRGCIRDGRQGGKGI